MLILNQLRDERDYFREIYIKYDKMINERIKIIDNLRISQ